MKVLVVDDYPGAAELLCVLLRMLGHEAQGATTAAEALDRATSFEPDVIVLDVGLPDQNGYEVARALRSRPGKRPFIAAMTGWNAPSDRALSLAAGIDLHVVKPPDADTMTMLLEAAKRRLDDDAAERPA